MKNWLLCKNFVTSRFNQTQKKKKKKKIQSLSRILEFSNIKILLNNQEVSNKLVKKI